MPTWNDFANLVSRASGTTVIGCYLSPRVLLTAPDLDDPVSALRVAWRIPSDGLEVLVTVGSGLFVEPPEELRTADAVEKFEAKLEFEEKAARALNMVVCELTLRGVVSEPAAPAFISRGTMIDGHVAILSVGGGREAYVDRDMDRLDDLRDRRWAFRPGRGVDVLNDAATLPWASKVAELSPHGPTLVAGAYSNLSRMQHAEAMADAWIVIEQYVDSLWSDYIAENKPRQDFLKDDRTFTAAVKLEVLAVDNRIESDLRDHIDIARRHRNKLHHGAEVQRDGAVAVLDTLREVLEAQCGGPVAAPLENRGLSW